MYKRLISETVIYGIGAILPRLINFALTPYYIKELDTVEYAVFTNLYALISFVNIILTFGFETAFFRFAAEKNQKIKALSTGSIFLFFNALIFLLICIIFDQNIANLLNFETHPEYIRWFGWIAFFDTICVIPFAWLRFNNRPIRYSAIRVTSSLANTLLVLCLFIVIPFEVSYSFGLRDKVSFPFFSNLFGSFIAFLLLSPIIGKIKLRVDFALFKRMISYAYPVMLAGLAFMVNENLDKAMQRFVISDAHAGAYGGCYKLAVLMTLFVTAYRLGIEPFFFKQMEKADARNTYARVTEYFVIAASFAALALIANIDWLKELFIRDRAYWVAIDIVPIIVIANLFFGIYYNMSTWYKVTDRTQMGTLISWAGAGVTILLNLLLLPYFGFMVSAWATLLAYLVMMCLSYILGQKYYTIPYRMKKILLYLGLCIGFSFLGYVVFNANSWLNNLLLIIYGGIVFAIEYKTLKLKLNR
ncbi:polysaccharide biosynthesis protein [Ornithobacterium rhinotracheale]|uniref:lipopolysaccharide biosynthesis protein n=1 Tax=Ornithobacterium rhinotracheale TaxID=28251 RepID=UPI00129CBA6C|nr:polysaccharide biosynthesis C-terminal domain-containing protein [Ornithobacterium rhinotracheale]MRJ10626.1 polysaccharide biosynthesis protein [Ornithobacterium rhinotracheale]